MLLNIGIQIERGKFTQKLSCHSSTFHRFVLQHRDSTRHSIEKVRMTIYWLQVIFPIASIIAAYVIKSNAITDIKIAFWNLFSNYVKLKTKHKFERPQEQRRGSLCLLTRGLHYKTLRIDLCDNLRKKLDKLDCFYTTNWGKDNDWIS